MSPFAVSVARSDRCFSCWVMCWVWEGLWNLKSKDFTRLNFEHTPHPPQKRMKVYKEDLEASWWWHIPLSPALTERWIPEIEASLVYRSSVRKARATEKASLEKETNRT